MFGFTRIIHETEATLASARKRSLAWDHVAAIAVLAGLLALGIWIKVWIFVLRFH